MVLAANAANRVFISRCPRSLRNRSLASLSRPATQRSVICATLPAFDVARDVSDRGVQVLDRVSGSQRAVQRGEDAQALHRQRVLKPLARPGRRARMPGPQRSGQVPASERVQCNAAGPLVQRLKTPWRDGTTHLEMSPPGFMQRLAALVARPGLQARPSSICLERQLCGTKSCGLSCSNGSSAGLRTLNLVAEDLPVALVRHTTDCWVNRVLARRRYW